MPAGGVVGVVAAAVPGYDTLRRLGLLPIVLLVLDTTGFADGPGRARVPGGARGAPREP